MLHVHHAALSLPHSQVHNTFHTHKCTALTHVHDVPFVLCLTMYTTHTRTRRKSLVHRRLTHVHDVPFVLYLTHAVTRRSGRTCTRPSRTRTHVQSHTRTLAHSPHTHTHTHSRLHSCTGPLWPSHCLGLSIALSLFDPLLGHTPHAHLRAHTHDPARPPAPHARARAPCHTRRWPTCSTHA